MLDFSGSCHPLLQWGDDNHEPYVPSAAPVACGMMTFVDHMYHLLLQWCDDIRGPYVPSSASVV
jgi:hypothetical protein